MFSTNLAGKICLKKIHWNCVLKHFHPSRMDSWLGVPILCFLLLFSQLISAKDSSSGATSYDAAEYSKLSQKTIVSLFCLILILILQFFRDDQLVHFQIQAKA